MRAAIRSVAVCLFVLCIMLWIGRSALAGEYDEGTAAGQTAGESIQSALGSTDGINQNISVPMTSSGTPMKTFGPVAKQQSFNAQLIAPSSNAYLEIFAQPGSTGDLQTIIIKQDINMDGTPDYVYTAPVIASGVCANGIISCDTGTWNNCHFYTWEVNSSMQVSLASVPDIKSLASCYCVNNSCGSDLVWHDMDIVLTDLGGGIVGMLQDANPHFAVTSVSTTATTITYYGQDTAGINQGSSGVYFSGSFNPEQYYAPETGNLPTDSEVQSQATDSLSPYYALAQAENGITNPVESKTCVIGRTIEFQSSGQPEVSVTDTCSALDLAGCTPNSETLCDYNGQNCVSSVQNSAATGLVPVSSQVSLVSQASGLTWFFNADGSAISYQDPGGGSGLIESGTDIWWNVHRDYHCTASYTYDASAGLSRTAGVSSTTNKTGNIMTYQDQGTTYSATLPDGQELPPCQMACEVQSPTTNTQAGADADTWDYQSSVTTYKTVYKDCANGTCPVETGETIIQNCACLNDFTKAASTMQVMDNASKDMICSKE